MWIRSHKGEKAGRREEARGLPRWVTALAVVVPGEYELEEVPQMG